MLDIRRARQKADDVNSRALFRTGIIGAVVAALCCATPILGLALATIGLSALAGKADYVLIPVLVASLGLVGIGLYRRNASTPAVIDCCETDKNTGKFKS
ncbi:MAG: mercury resistance system transport protein MerF [Hyphomicrobium sp.]|uniref:mercury resistance system transport protein MerF n=1 Tax=Hyphomicrobium sp. TaxID=82 RepID=UPI0025BCCFB5|nr:mercury resistance system transport protein MerF [Hyphomicrobium sp.]MBX9864557.1 mercury resistance system transport protein MerF [Hyphomicrobium sp.]